MWVSPQSAEQFVRWLDAAHTARLQELAAWLRDRGGPVDEMDATTASLIPLWEWLIDEIQAGLPGIDIDAHPANGVFLRYPADAPHMRARAAGEPIGHYLFEVLRREYPAIRWAVDPLSTKKHGTFQQPGALLAKKKFMPLFTFVQNGASGVERNVALAFRPDSLLVQLERGGWERPEGEKRGPSILTPLLDMPPLPMPPIPVAEELIEPDDGSWSASDTGAILAIDLDLALDPDSDLADWPPLDEELIAEHLDRDGWRTLDGGPVTPDDVRTDGARLVWGDDRVHLEVTTADGRARFLKPEIIRVTDAEWDRIHGGLLRLAAALGGWLDVPHEG